MSSDNTKKVVLAVGGVVIAAGAVWYLTRKPEQEPELIVKPKSAAASTTASATGSAQAPAKVTETQKPKPTPAAAAAAAAERDDMESALRQTTTMLATEYSFSGDSVAATEGANTKAKTYQPPVPDKDGVIFFESLGVRFQVARGWNVAEEPSPMPNVAMISFTKPEFAERQSTGMPGETPVVLLSIEDISNEQIPTEEFREKSKAMALGQMQMMTNNMFQPNIVEDSKLSSPIGPFTHILHYELRTPYFGMAVLNLTTVVDGLAYIMQVMTNPNEFKAVKEGITGMCRSMAFSRRPAPEDFRQLSSITVTGPGGCASIPPSFSVERSNSANPVFAFQTASQSRKEKIEVFDGTKTKAPDHSKATAKSTSTVNGVTVTDYGSNLRVAVKGNVVVQVTPSHTHGVVTTPAVLSAIANSVDLSKQSDEDKLWYHSKVLQFGFEARGGSRVIESRLSERILVYAPNGLPQDPSANEDPMLTIRVGDPSNDPDCRTTYEEWMDRIKNETESESISDLKKDEINGMKCVTFVNKEMQEVAPGQKEERMAKVLIFLKGIRTTMLRWETPSGAWRKHENKLKAVLNTLKID